MSNIKKLATQTIWYGLPTILTRFIGLTITIVVLRKYPPEITGDFQIIYVVIPIFMILYTYGLETSYFRFALTENKKKLFNTTFSSIISTSIIFSVIIVVFSKFLADILDISHQIAMIKWMAVVLFIDTVSAIPFAKLRQEERPRKFAFIKMMMVIVQFILTVLIYNVWIPYLKIHPNGFLHDWYNGNDMVYFIIANAVGSFVSLILLYSEWKNYRPQFDRSLMNRILLYSLPLVLVGFIGMSNESLGRVVFSQLLHLSEQEIKIMVGVLLTTYKLAILINVFTQMFRIAAEPFFFSKSVDKDAKQTYSQSLIMYLIISAYALLIVVFFKEIWLSFFTGKMQSNYDKALYILPVLSFTMILTGIYYTQTVWYKLTDKNIYGAYMALIGLLVNFVFLLVLVPQYTYLGVAISALMSNIALVIISYIWGQKFYPVPYNIPKIIMHFIILILLVVILGRFQQEMSTMLSRLAVGVLSLLLYSVFVFYTEPNLKSKLMRR